MDNTTVSTGPYLPVATITGPSVIVPTEFALFNVDATSAGFTITLPPAAGCVGLPLTFKAIHANTNVVTVAASGSDQINGASTQTLGPQVSGAGFQSLTLISDDLAWRIV